MLTFVDVSEIQAAAQEPKDATRYSDRNSIASNPDADKNLNETKIDGTQKESQQTEDSKRNKFNQLIPDPPKPQPLPGNMILAKADTNPQPEKKRPRTLKDVLDQKSKDSKKASQDGGARQKFNTSHDVKATGFGAYDKQLIDAISSRWHFYLDRMSLDNYRQGKVLIVFELNYKGDISEVRIISNSTDSEILGTICRMAIIESSGAGEWPREMRLMMGGDTRQITFSFNYL